MGGGRDELISFCVSYYKRLDVARRMNTALARCDDESDSRACVCILNNGHMIYSVLNNINMITSRRRGTTRFRYDVRECFSMKKKKKITTRTQSFLFLIKREIIHFMLFFALLLLPMFSFQMQYVLFSLL